MLIIGSKDIKELVSMTEAIEAVSVGFSDYSSGKAKVPLRTVISAEKGDILFMPGYVPSTSSAAVKVVSVFPENAKHSMPSVMAMIILLDANTGRPLAVMDGTYLTALRTGAAGGLAVKLLAREDATKLLLFGAGMQGYTQVEAAISVRNIKKVWVFDLFEEARKRFCRNMSGLYKDIEFQPIEDYNNVISEADIIITATTSHKPVFDGRMVPNGVHINAIGAYRPDMQEIDATVVMRADKLVVDSRSAVLAESGDIIIPIKDGLVKESIIYAEIGEVLIGKRRGRESIDEITIFETVGIAVEDVAVAELVYKKAMEKGVGMKLEEF